MNFRDTYKAIVTKSKGDEVILRLLEEKITKNPHLAKQFVIYNTLLEADKDKVEETMSLLENYAQKLKYDDLAEANDSLAQFFNIDKKKVKNNDPVDEAIDQMLRANAGGFMPELGNTTYRKAILENLTKEKSLLEENTLKVFNEELAEELQSTNLLEQEALSLLETKFSNLDRLSLSIKNEKEKAFIQECITQLKQSAPKKQQFKEAVLDTFNLQDVILKLIENKTTSLKDGKNLKNISLTTYETSPITIGLKFEHDLAFKAENYLSLKESLDKTTKKAQRFNKNIKQIIVARDKDLSKIKDVTCEYVVPNGIRLTDKATMHGEVTFTLDENNQQIIQKFVNKLDESIIKWLA